MPLALRRCARDNADDAKSVAGCSAGAAWYAVAAADSSGRSGSLAAQPSAVTGWVAERGDLTSAVLASHCSHKLALLVLGGCHAARGSCEQGPSGVQRRGGGLHLFAIAALHTRTRNPGPLAMASSFPAHRECARPSPDALTAVEKAAVAANRCRRRFSGSPTPAIASLMSKPIMLAEKLPLEARRDEDAATPITAAVASALGVANACSGMAGEAAATRVLGEKVSVPFAAVALRRRRVPPPAVRLGDVSVAVDLVGGAASTCVTAAARCGGKPRNATCAADRPSRDNVVTALARRPHSTISQPAATEPANTRKGAKAGSTSGSAAGAAMTTKPTAAAQPAATIGHTGDLTRRNARRTASSPPDAATIAECCSHDSAMGVKMSESAWTRAWRTIA